MKNPARVVLAISVASLLSLNIAFAVPTKDIVQPGQGLAAAQKACPKYAGDEAKEAACVLFHAGAIKKTNGVYQVNVQLLQPVVEASAEYLVKCKAEMIYLPDGGIGWKETSDCY